jgi:hypothetical protein
MKALRIYRNTVRVLACAGYMLAQWYFIPFGALSGLITGLIFCAIWISREPDPK